MMNYRDYTVEELARDENFRQWILNPDAEVAAFWENWMTLNPDRCHNIHQATALLLVLQKKYQDDLSDRIIKEEINRLVARAEMRSSYACLHFFQNPFLRVAAMLVVLSGLGTLYWLHHSAHSKSGVYENIAGVALISRTNNTDKEMTVLLGDGSVAILKKESSLQFPHQFSGNSRTVILTGEAFFDVAKNPSKPFLVYANETVTKVLGTSFRVRAAAGGSTTMVVVKTGKVAVFPEKAYAMQKAEHTEKEPAGVVLQPNQQVIYNRKDQSLEKGIVENPALLSESGSIQELVFDDEPVANVLNTLKELYGIEIQFDQKRLSKCPISTIFKEESLKQRLNAICQAIGATYEVVDGRILLHSKGCNQ